MHVKPKNSARSTWLFDSSLRQSMNNESEAAISGVSSHHAHLTIDMDNQRAIMGHDFKPFCFLSNETNLLSKTSASDFSSSSSSFSTFKNFPANEDTVRMSDLE